jgi:mono/diheme cytochrome c family protein
VNSSIPDLRTASAQTFAQLSAIVLGGARLDKGMPAFPALPADQLKAIQAYILNEAWTAYDAQEAHKSTSSPQK